MDLTPLEAQALATLSAARLYVLAELKHKQECVAHQAVVDRLGRPGVTLQPGDGGALQPNREGV